MATSSSPPNSPDTIVLIHGLWMTPRSWEHWKERYEGQGYKVLAPAWPGLEVEVEALRADPTPLTKLSGKQVIDSYDRIIRALDSPPIIMGHSLGGAVTQVLLDRGLGAAAVGVAPATVKGIRDLPLSTLRATGHILSRPFNRGNATPSSRKQFKYGFANTMTQEESDAIYDRYYVPSANRVLYDIALSNLSRTRADGGRLRQVGQGAAPDDRLRARPRRAAEADSPQRFEVQGRHRRVHRVPRSAALPRRAGLGGGRRLRPLVGGRARGRGAARGVGA